MKRKPDPAGQFMRAHLKMRKMMDEAIAALIQKHNELNGELALLNQVLSNRHGAMQRRFNELEAKINPICGRKAIWRDFDVDFNPVAGCAQ
jgi:hypothetical protein